jgi:hypothetical protein
MDMLCRLVFFAAAEGTLYADKNSLQRLALMSDHATAEAVLRASIQRGRWGSIPPRLRGSELF